MGTSHRAAHCLVPAYEEQSGLQGGGGCWSTLFYIEMLYVLSPERTSGLSLRMREFLELARKRTSPGPEFACGFCFVSHFQTGSHVYQAGLELTLYPPFKG